MQATHRNPRISTSRQPLWRACITASIGAALLAVTLALAGSSAAAQPLEAQERKCLEVWGVDGAALWLLCSGVDLDDVRDLERDAKPTEARLRTDQQNINKWMFWLGHSGFVMN